MLRNLSSFMNQIECEGLESGVLGCTSLVWGPPRAMRKAGVEMILVTAHATRIAGQSNMAFLWRLRAECRDRLKVNEPPAMKKLAKIERVHRGGVPVLVSPSSRILQFRLLRRIGAARSTNTRMHGPSIVCILYLKYMIHTRCSHGYSVSM